MPKGIYKRSPELIASITERIKKIRPPKEVYKIHSQWMKRNNPMMNELSRKKVGESKIGKARSLITRQRMSKTIRQKYGLKITSDRRDLMQRIEYKLWRKSVYQRDDYTCQICKKRGGRLEADHIKPFSRFPELRYAIDNGRTLCVSCHSKTDTYGGRINKGRKLAK